MSTLYNLVIAIGFLGLVTLAVLVAHCDLPGWKWIIFIVAIIANDLGCYAQRDKQTEQNK